MLSSDRSIREVDGQCYLTISVQIKSGTYFAVASVSATMMCQIQQSSNERSFIHHTAIGYVVGYVAAAGNEEELRQSPVEHSPLRQKEIAMNDVEVQAQDASGVWRTMSVVVNNPQRIVMEMQSIARRYPTYRVRAVDRAGRLIDLL